MRKAAQQAREFAANPPAQTRFTPVPYKLIEECGRRWRLCTQDGEPFDPMEIGDFVVLMHSTTSYYQGRSPSISESWYPATCISAAEERVFELREGVRWKEMRAQFKIYRVPYHWRGQLHKLLGQEFSSRAELETAMGDQP